MMIDRNTMRTVVPPVLALGLIALAVRPVDAAPVQAPAMAATGGAPTAARPSAARPASGGNVSVGLPAVAFQQQFQVVGGRLHTAVLVNVAEPAGHARVIGLPRCEIDLTPGVVGWLDCAYQGGPMPRTITIQVRLADGRQVLSAQPGTLVS